MTRRAFRTARAGEHRFSGPFFLSGGRGRIRCRSRGWRTGGLGAGVALLAGLACSGALAAAAAAAGDAGISAPPGEVWKALWVKADQLATDRAIKETVRRAAEWGASDLFVQVRVRGDALYPSRLVPASPSLTARRGPARQVLPRDPVRLVLREAHARGLRVHAWFNCFVAWSSAADPPAGHVLSLHPGWALRLADGRAPLRMTSTARRREGLEGVYLAPGSTEVREHLLALVDELVRAYPLDGLHWDYVRYPGTPSLDPGDPGGDALADTTRARQQRSAVSRFVQEAARVARAGRPGIRLSAAVFADPEDAVREVRQDWISWLERGWIDRAVPMSYTASIYRLDDLRHRATVAGADSARVVYGLGVHQTDAEALRAELSWARRRSPAGVCLFAYDHVKKRPGAAQAVQAAWRGPWVAGSE